MPFIFPDDLGVTAKNANYMGFQTYQINGGVGSAKSDRDYKLVGGSVYLPIPVEGITDSTSNSWSPGDVNVAQMATASAVKEAGIDFSAASSGQDLVRNVIGAIGDKWNSAKSAAASVDPAEIGRKALTATVSEVGDAFSSGMTTMGDALMKGAGPMGIGMGLNMLGAPVTQSTGIAGFNETAILYGGPQFRANGEIKIENVSLKPKAVIDIPMNLGVVIKAERLLDFKPNIIKIIEGNKK